MIYYKNFSKKNIFKIIIIFALIFFIGGIGGVYFDQRILPFIRTNKWANKIDFLKKVSENVTVINKTEQVIIKEDDSINKVASQASNAVVNIVSTSSIKQGYGKLESIINKSSAGTIVSSDGMIVTFRGAIIEKDARYHVFLYDGSHFDAELIGIDEFSDLAYLKISTSNLTVISFADSADVRPGKKIIAIGNSFGEYQNRYSAGLLSNINKTFNLSGQSVASSEKLEGVFETDFENKTEFLGAPIIGYSGDMVGIIGKVYIDNKDIYFIIPSNFIKKSLENAFNKNFNNNLALGIYYISITKEYAFAHNLNIDRGALIYSPSGKQGLAVISNSIAEKNGFKIGDIITAIGNQGVNLDNPLSNLLSQYKKGNEVEITINRNGQEIKTKILAE